MYPRVAGNYIIVKEENSEKLEINTVKLKKLIKTQIKKIWTLKKGIFENKTENTRMIKMSKSEDLRCHSFDGKDYSIWKKRILLYLKWKKCDEPVTRKKLATEDQTE